uniref:NAC family transcription factor n=1 Tax=Melilotus albus TaxID=47082 RepID=A0A896WBW5_MELAB|nr:NAC family transcription factor [Melilotus albus]
MTFNTSSLNRDFTPTDDELLQPFLYNKIHNKPLPNYITILEYDLFGTVKNPWEIWEEFEASHSYRGKDLYFFTTLKKKSATGSRLVRTIGLGTWEGEDAGKNIVAKDKNQLLGVKKRFRFEKSDTYQDGGWLLHQYSLDKSLISNPSAKNYVLCRFRKNCIDFPRKNTRTKNIVAQDIQRITVVPGRAATIIPENNNVRLGENIDQNPRNQLNNRNNETEDDGKCIIKEEEEEEDGDASMSWPELFSLQLRNMDEGCLIKEEDVPMISNKFYKDLLLENININ